MKQVSIKQVLEIINGIDNIVVTEEQLDDNLSDLGVDSINFIRIIVALEEEFECEVPDSKLMISEMDTIKKIVVVLKTLYEDSFIYE